MIKFENVEYSYAHQEKSAVRNINFEVPAGKIVLCSGASGCGKTTLMRLANGLCPQHYKGKLTGKVRIFDYDTVDASMSELSSQVGTLFQDPEQQFFALTVSDEIAFSHECRAVPAEEILETLDIVLKSFSIEHIKDSSIHDLSEGQKQKVGLASLCSQKLKALILDEPTANLDPESTRDLAHKLVELRELGLAIFVVDHRLYWLENIADTVLVMSDGEIKERGEFNLLYDEELRKRYGLREAQVKDTRFELPTACLVSGDIENSDNTENFEAVENSEAIESSETIGNSESIKNSEDIKSSKVIKNIENKGLRIENMTFSYKGKTPIFDNRHFYLGTGITALIGDNGAGKTTLARIMTGLNSVEAGEFYLDNVKIPQKELIKHIGVVLQNADHQLHMRTVFEEIQTCYILAHQLTNKKKLKIKKSDRAHIFLEQSMETLTMLGLDHLKERHPQSLSGGEKQRLIIACALAKKPSILILDEPTSGLDGLNMHRIKQALEDFARQGSSVLVITHDLELITKSCRFAIRL